MSFRSTADTKEKTSITSVSSLSIIPPSHNKFSQGIGNKQKTEENIVHDALADSSPSHDFKQIRVHAPKEGGVNNQAMQSCPMTSTPRACPFGGACHICPANVMTKLAVSKPGDKYEQEADRIAEQITGMSEHQVMRKTVDDGYSQTSVVPGVADKALSSHGHPLETGIRTFMESRFRHDFSNVRVHTDSKATESAKALNAKAYTLGQDIVFGSGQYQSTTEGKKLLAHELAHVFQQGIGIVPSAIQCKNGSDTPTGSGFTAMLKEQSDLRKFDFGARVMKERYSKIYLKNKTKVDELLDQARASLFRLEYLAAIKTALKTPYIGGTGHEEEQREFREENVKTFKEFSDEAKTLQGTPGAGEEEAVSQTVPQKAWVKLKGEAGKTFCVDRRNVRNIVVLAKVKLEGPPEHVQYVKDIEDLVENRCARPGYTVNLCFVDRVGPDIFNVNVDLGSHPVSSRWSGFPKKDVPEILAHELHHLLGLPDRYDYLELSSAGTLNVSTRLYWIGVQLQKDIARGSRVDPLAEVSLMGSGKYLHSADICKVIQVPEVTCVEARKGLE